MLCFGHLLKSLLDFPRREKKKKGNVQVYKPTTLLLLHLILLDLKNLIIKN